MIRLLARVYTLYTVELLDELSFLAQVRPDGSSVSSINRANNTKIFYYFRQYVIWDLTTATLNNLLDFFFNFFICARYFFFPFFRARIFFFWYLPNPPLKNLMVRPLRWAHVTQDGRSLLACSKLVDKL